MNNDISRRQFLASSGRALLLLSASAAGVDAANEAKEYTAHVLGHIHLDMAWLWRWEEEIDDIMHLFRHQLQLINRFPDYTYGQDQAVVYEMMEDHYPDVFKEIEYGVKTHRWIPLSSCWTQMDENMPDGESLVRQFLYGQKYSQEKFGHYVRVGWQIDAFGHPASLPQILRKSGVEWYVFSRPHDPPRPPISWWHAPDGTRVLAYHGMGGLPVDAQTAAKLVGAANRAGVKDAFVWFGGEGPEGGPSVDELERMAKFQSSPEDVHVIPTDVNEYFDLLLARKQDFPILEGELNPDFSGCYTTQVEMKRNNRVAEQLLLNAEKMSEIAVLNQFRDFYPVTELNKAWKLTLINQTHDLLPGSGIGPIYRDAADQYREVFERGRRALDFSLETLGLQLNTEGEGIPVVVYNPHSWDRTDLVTVEIEDLALPVSLIARHGSEAVPVQVIRPPSRQGDLEKATVCFVAQNVPQMGLKLYRLVRAAAQNETAGPLQVGSAPRPFIENEFLRIEIDPVTGSISRLYDKQAGREALKSPGHHLVAYEDTASQAHKETSEYSGTSWNIGLTGVKWDLDKAERVEVFERGPVRATVRVVHRFRHSLFTQDISLAIGVPRADVQMSMEWHERCTFLKAVFAVNAASNKVSADIPYGVIEREQNGQEAVMGKWVDIADANFGIAVINNGRHGYDAASSVLRLSVIRGAEIPDPRADDGYHEFGFAMYPHRGGWRDGKVPLHALNFNSPLIARQEDIHKSPEELIAPCTAPGPQCYGKKGGVPDAWSGVQTHSDHVMLYAMKQRVGFNDTDAILRFFEYEGREGDVTVDFPFTVHASETNLLEDTIGPLGSGTTISFHVKPWEIKSIRLAFRR